MRAISSSALLALALFCWSCETGTQPKTAVPATPQPAVIPPPVVEPQTVVQLPAPQPLPPESVPPRLPVEYQLPIKEVEPEPEKPADPKSPRAPQRVTKSARRIPAEDSAPVAPPADEPAKPQTLSAQEDSRVSKEYVSGKLEQVQAVLKNIASRYDTKATQTAVARIRSSVRLSEQAAARGDLRQAKILAERALALANDLTRPQ